MTAHSPEPVLVGTHPACPSPREPPDGHAQGGRGPWEGFSPLSRACRTLLGSWPRGCVWGLPSSGLGGGGCWASDPHRLTARDVQAGGAEGLARGIGGNAGVGALVLSAHVQQDQTVLLGRAGHRVAW